MNAKKTKLISLLLIITLLASSCTLNVRIRNHDIPDYLNGPYKVLSIVDGDTIQVKIDGEKVKVRLIGVDCPESVHPDEDKNTSQGKTASEFTQQLLDGQKVYLEYDVSIYDQYGRTLAYVYLSDAETMLNRELLINGYAVVMTIQPNVKYSEEFYQLQKQAQDQKTGFWAE